MAEKPSQQPQKSAVHNRDLTFSGKWRSVVFSVCLIQEACFGYRKCFHSECIWRFLFHISLFKILINVTRADSPPPPTWANLHYSLLFVLKAWWKSLIQVTRQPCRWENIMFGLLHLWKTQWPNAFKIDSVKHALIILCYIFQSWGQEKINWCWK